MRRLFSGILVMTAVLAACDDTGTGPDSEVEVIADPVAVAVVTGQSATVVVNVRNADNTAVTWRSDNPAVATAAAPGIITGHAAGATKIRVISVQDTMKRATIDVVVTPISSPPGSGPDTLPTLGHGVVNDRWTAEVAVRDNYAYTSTWSNRAGARGDAVKIWNVAGNTPVLVDSLIVTGAGTTSDVQISDDGGLLVVSTENGANNGIAIYDRTNPAVPVLLRRWTHPETGPGVHTVKLGRVNGRHYAFLSINTGSTGARLMIVDITDPSNPQFVWSERMGAPYVHDVFVRDGILFTALWDDGLRIYDIGGGGRGGSPSSPVVMGSVKTRTGNIHNIWWFHDPSVGGSGKRYVFLGEESTSGVGFSSRSAAGDVHVIDVSNMSTPVQVAQFAVQGAGSHNFSMDEQSGILYAAYYNGGVRAIDVRGQLGTCTTAQRNADGFCDLRLMGREKAVALTDDYVWGVAWQGTHLYASDMEDGLYKLDVSALRR